MNTIAEGPMDGRGVVRAMADVVRAARDLDAFHQRKPGAPHEGERLRVALHSALRRLDDVTIDAAVAAIAHDAAGREVCCEDHERGVVDPWEPCDARAVCAGGGDGGPDTGPHIGPRVPNV